MYFSRLRLGARLGWSFSLVLLLTVLMLGLAAVQLSQLRTQVQALSGVEAEKAERAARWHDLNALNLTRAIYVAKAQNHPALAALAPTEMKATSDEIVANGQRMRELATDEESRAIIARIDAEVTGYLDIRKQAMAKVAAADPGAAAYVDQVMVPAAHRYMETVRSLREVQNRKVAEQARATTEAAAQALLWLGVGCVLTLALGGWLAWAATRAVTHPLQAAVAVSQRIAEGRLDRPVHTSRGDELGDLLRALAVMQDNLRGMVHAVRDSSESINVASAEVASGNQDLSSRTEHAASSLQETASSMEQLTGTVRQSAESARQANELARHAAQTAQRGGDVVSQVVHTMQEISQSSARIADIIGVIDGIAFQTNILALNAAVEAARAGDQGRGFAVVAGEVRSLAQRSAQAAKEIKGLIGTSVDKVQAGAALVGDAGTSMADIVAAIQRVSDMMGDIHAAAAEQSAGISQVSTAVSQLDQVTQQNAALVEESAAAAESLREQAGRLHQVVGTFRLGELAPA